MTRDRWRDCWEQRGVGARKKNMVEVESYICTLLGTGDLQEIVSPVYIARSLSLARLSELFTVDFVSTRGE
jgi:hypothetical protein